MNRQFDFGWLELKDNRDMVYIVDQEFFFKDYINLRTIISFCPIFVC